MPSLATRGAPAGVCAVLAFIATCLLPPGLTTARSEGDAGHIATFWREGDPGERLVITGRVLDSGGKPVAGATVDLRQADGTGSYRPDAYRGRIRTDEQGRYEVRTVVPESYYGARHIHVTVTHESDSIDTSVLFKGDPNLPEGNAPGAIVLEESRVKGDVVFIGTFDIVMPGH